MPRARIDSTVTVPPSERLPAERPENDRGLNTVYAGSFPLRGAPLSQHRAPSDRTTVPPFSRPLRPLTTRTFEIPTTVSLPDGTDRPPSWKGCPATIRRRRSPPVAFRPLAPRPGTTGILLIRDSLWNGSAEHLRPNRPRGVVDRRWTFTVARVLGDSTVFGDFCPHPSRLKGVPVV